MAVLGPRIGKVQVDPGDLIRGKNLREFCGIHADKKQVFRWVLCIKLLDGAQEHTRVALNSDIVDLGVSSCLTEEKLTLSHTDFDMDRLLFLEMCIPFAAQGGRFIDHVGAGGDSSVCARYIAKSHIVDRLLKKSLA